MSAVWVDPLGDIDFRSEFGRVVAEGSGLLALGVHRG